MEGLGGRHVCVLVHSWCVFYFSCSVPSFSVFPGVGRVGFGTDSCGLVGGVRRRRRRRRRGGVWMEGMQRNPRGRLSDSPSRARTLNQPVMSVKTTLVLFSNSFYLLVPPISLVLPPPPTFVFLKNPSCQELKQ